MQEQKISDVVIASPVSKRTLTIFIKSSLLILTGDWYWDIHTDAVFCSDVIIALPESFDGTRSIIHPDDLHIIEEEISFEKERIIHIEFRIITTYGEVRTVTGENITVCHTSSTSGEMNDIVMQHVRTETLWKKDYHHLQLLKEIYEKAERYTGIGIWWYNAQTNETWYSNEVYRIYDLPPHSLNAHLNTFTGFIHPDDKDSVTEFIDKSIKKKVPINIEFRIKTSTSVKNILLTTHWLYSSSGEVILSGIVQDITEQKQFEQKFEFTRNSSDFYKQQLLFDEKNVNLGHWQVDLVTRKNYYSDQYFRIFGLKPQSSPGGLNTFSNFIYPDDRDAVMIAAKKMLYEHKAPELDYRIIRSDGKLRYISQKGKLISYGNNELLMMGTIQDVTVQKMLEKKINELNENLLVQNFAHRQSEEIAGIGSWTWNLKSGKIKWSDSFYNLLGLKPNSVELSQNRLLLFIHPEDQKKFKDELTIALDQHLESDFDFRMVLRGQVKYMKASFRLLINEAEQLFIGIIQDNTHQYLLQQDLFQRMQTAEALSENVLDRVIITDLSNTIIAWNKQCEIIYSIRKENALGQNFFDVFPQLKTEEQLQLFNKVLRGETIHLSELKSSSVGGYFDLHMLPVWNEHETEVNGIIHIIHDVTKEIQLRRTLNDRLSFIENLVESSVDRIIAMDRNLNYLVWNKKCEEYYGLKKQDVIGKNLLEVFPETQYTPTYEEFKKVLKGETIHISAQKDRAETFHEIYLIPVKNEKDDIIAILWILHDLSKEFAAEKRFEHQSNLLQAVFDASLNGIILFKAIREENNIIDYEVVLNNHTTRKWNGRDLVGKRYGVEFPGIREYGIFDEYNKVLDTGIPMNKEIFYGENGVGDWYRITAVKMNDEELVATAENITASKIAAEELINHKDLLQQTTSATPDAITIYDLDAKLPVYLNNCLGDWLGYKSEELIRMGYEGRLNIVHPDDRNKLKEFNQDMLSVQGNDITTIDYRLQTKSGKTIWIRNRSRVFKKNSEGKVTHILSILQDVTEIMNRKEELILLNKTLALKNKELERKNEEITNFAFVASHDLKEPLRKIITFSDWLLTRESDNISQSGKDYLKKLFNSAKRIETLIRDIVDLTRVHADYSKEERVNLNSVAENVLFSMSDYIKETGTEIEIKNLPVLNGNSSHLNALFTNMISNGIKFQKQGNHPHLLIESELVESSNISDIQNTEYKHFFRISFTDNGIGIEKKFTRKIFTIFQRLHPAHEFEGTGMGLTICKKIMENHDGFITVESEPGIGSTFSCYFPVNPEN